MFHNVALQNRFILLSRVWVYSAECEEPGCRFKGTWLSLATRHRKVHQHRRTAIRKLRRAALANMLQGDEKRVREAFRQFADIMTHDEKDWVSIVDGLMRAELGVDLSEADVTPGVLRQLYGAGIDAQRAVGILIQRQYEVKN